MPLLRRSRTNYAVFSKNGTLRHVHAMHPDEGDNTVHGIDLLNPVWHVFDLTPAGRGDVNLRNDIPTYRGPSDLETTSPDVTVS